MPIKLVLMVLAFLIPSEAFAEDEAPRRWKGEAEAGVLATDGNTNTRNISARVGLELNLAEKWANEFGLEALYSEDSGEAAAERYVLYGKGSYRLDRANYVYLKARFENDRFAGYDHRISESAGYGRFVVRSEKLTIRLEGGPGGTHIKFRDSKKVDELILNLAGKLSWRLGDTATLGQEITADIGETRNVTESVTSLQTLVVGNLTTKIAYTLRNDSNPAPDTGSTDTRLSVTLVFSF
jgi:putative salt-induced outer membrane protein YdiY